MIYAIIISAAIIWALLALFSPVFNHLDEHYDDPRNSK